MKLIVVTADARHRGYLGAYGNDWIETPALARLAVEGIVFDNHIADQPDAEDQHRAMHQITPRTSKTASGTPSALCGRS